MPVNDSCEFQSNVEEEITFSSKVHASPSTSEKELTKEGSNQVVATKAAKVVKNQKLVNKKPKNSSSLIKGMMDSGTEGKEYLFIKATLDGLRKSKRKRFEPLEYWKNEKVVYGRRQSAGIINL